MEKAEAVSSPEIYVPVLIDIGDIVPSPINEGGKRMKQEDIDSLAETIRAHGLISAITVRPLEFKEPGHRKYEIVCGERRWRACKTLWKKMPVIIRELSDNDAYQITAIENLHREDLTPLQEANSIQKLIDTGMDIRVIADKIGKPVSWVVRRAKLKDLTTKWKSAISDPDHVYATWSASHLELVARFYKNVQDEVFDRLSHMRSTITIKELRQELNTFLLKLSAAPWKLTDADVYPKAGACSKCMKRASVQPDLFMLEADQIKSDRCADKFCWAAKLEAFLMLKEAALRRTDKNMILIDFNEWHSRILPSDSPLKKRVAESYKYVEVKKKDPEAVPALVIDGSQAGHVVYMKLIYESDKKKEKVKETIEGKRAKLQGIRDKKFTETVLEIVCEEIKEPNRIIKIAGNDVGFFRMLAAVLAFGCRVSTTIPGEEFGTGYQESNTRYARFTNVLDKLCKHFPEKNDYHHLIIIDVYRNILPYFREFLNCYAPGGMPELAKQACEFLGVDWGKIRMDIEADLPEPKSWAREDKTAAEAETTDAASEAKERVEEKKKARKKTAASEPEESEEADAAKV